MSQVVGIEVEAEPFLVSYLMCRTALDCLALYRAGLSLLQLPVAMLQQVSKHFQAQEWAQGPSQTCSLLNHMQLPRIILEPLLPRTDPSIVSFCSLS